MINDEQHNLEVFTTFVKKLEVNDNDEQQNLEVFTTFVKKLEVNNK